MPDLLVRSFAPFLLALQPCFTRPIFASFWALTCAWILCSGRRSLTRIIQSAQLTKFKHFCSFHRFFSQARWNLDDLGRCVFQLLLPLCAEVLVAAVDDTLARKSGRHIWGAGMHHDPLRSTQKRPFFSFGHNFVVLSLQVALPFAPNKYWAFPILVRMYQAPDQPARSRQRRKTGAQANRPSHSQAISHPPRTSLGDDSDGSQLDSPATAARSRRQRVCRPIHQPSPARQRQAGQPHEHEGRPL